MSLLKLLLAMLSLMTMGARAEITPPPVQEVSQSPTVNVEEIAQCLNEKGVKFYGAYWCPHCSDQKKLFGDAMASIEYIECDPRGEGAQPEVCDALEIESYPTWILPDGQKFTGTQQPNNLARSAGCL